MELTEYVALMPDMKNTGANTPLDVSLAENELGLSFADEYAHLLKTYGAVCVKGHDINGLTESEILSVIDMTRKARLNARIPDNMYVVENLGVEDIMILQNSAGEVFECRESSISRIADSLLDYLRFN